MCIEFTELIKWRYDIRQSRPPAVIVELHFPGFVFVDITIRYVSEIFLNEENMGTLASAQARCILVYWDQVAIFRHAILLWTCSAVIIAFAWMVLNFELCDVSYPVDKNKQSLTLLLIVLEVVNLVLEFFERGDDLGLRAV